MNSLIEALKPFYLFSISDTSVACHAANLLPITPVSLRELKKKKKGKILLKCFYEEHTYAEILHREKKRSEV